MKVSRRASAHEDIIRTGFDAHDLRGAAHLEDVRQATLVLDSQRDGDLAILEDTGRGGFLIAETLLKLDALIRETIASSAARCNIRMTSLSAAISGRRRPPRRSSRGLVAEVNPRRYIETARLRHADFCSTSHHLQIRSRFLVRRSALGLHGGWSGWPAVSRP